MAGKQHYPEEVIKKAVDLYKTGLSSAMVAQQLEISTQSISRWVLQAGANRSVGHLKNKPEWFLEIQQRIFARYRKGETVPEILQDFPELKKMTVWLWLRKEGLTRRRGAVEGSQNPLWRGGIYEHEYPVEWTFTLKESIRQRDGYKCQLCGVPQEECFCRLAVHHRDANKTNLNPDNLISLCGSCHRKVHKKGEVLSER